MPRAPFVISAVQSLPNRFAGKLGWDFEQLLPFQKAYVAGFRVARPTKDLPTAYSSALNLAAYDLEIAVQKEVSAEEQKLLRYKPAYPATTFRLILLPLFAGHFMHEGRKHDYAINGYDGTLAGDLPTQVLPPTPQPTVVPDARSRWRKIGATILAVVEFAAGGLILLLKLIVKLFIFLYRFF